MAQLKLDGKLVKEKIANFIRNTVKRAAFGGGVVGGSGGLDSTVALHLAGEALGPQNVWAILLPYGIGDEKDLRDASEVINNLGVNSTKIDISAVVQTLLASLTNRDRVRKGNLICRIRMMILYDQAFKHNALVLGTSNRTELLLGYFTKYGDGGVDILPLGNLLKSQVRELAISLAIPAEIIEKPPSAGLWDGQTDEEEMGISYEELDRYLSSGEAQETIKRTMDAMMQASAHKRSMPPVPPF